MIINKKSTQSGCGDIKQRLADYFDEHFDEILDDLGEILSINSAFSEPEDGKPFGAGSAAALAWGAQKGRELGLHVRNFDNYAVSMTYGLPQMTAGTIRRLRVPLTEM